MDKGYLLRLSVSLRTTMSVNTLGSNVVNIRVNNFGRILLIGLKFAHIVKLTDGSQRRVSLFPEL